ncbi:hypothetical protein GQ600_8397 [Phytophthora cactorum]|nr:hypothetical protein GQ600_8397 [Phytophthora cactorum]
MGRPLLPIWKEFVTTVPADADKRSPDVECLHCRSVVCNARPTNLLRHALNCPDMPAEELKVAMAEQQQLNQTQNRSEDGETEESEISVTERRPVLGKRPRVRSGQDNLERVLTSIRDVMAQTLECKQQELQLRREELEFQKEALATKMEERRQAREEDRRDRREQSEADRQEKLELARIENEKNLAFLKAVMESSAQQRR